MPPLMMQAPTKAGMRAAGSTRPRPSSGGRGTVVRARASAAMSQGMFCTWTHDNGAQLPERVQDYLGLLAESSTTGMMQKHLVKLMVKGADAALKAGEIVVNPMDSLTDCVADASADFLIKQVANSSHSSGWSKLRSAVMGTSMFKVAGKSKDDSYLPPPQIDPAHSKALGVLVSVLMSSAVSGAADAMPEMPFMNQHSSGVEISQQANLQSKFQHASSMKAAPSFALRGDSSSEMMSTGGMAASTAMKLLRADSKVADTIPDLKDIFSSAMDSIEEEHDDSVINKVLKRGPGGFGGAGNGGFNGGFGGSNSGGTHNGQPRA